MAIQLLMSIISILMAIVAFFLIRTMSKLDKTSEKTYKNSSEIALLKQGTDLKQERLEEKFDELNKAVTGLTDELRRLREFPITNIR